jgi:hypothetical protein
MALCRSALQTNGAAVCSLPFAPLGRSRERIPVPTVDGIDTDTSTETMMIRKLRSGEYRLYSRKINSATGKRRNLGTFRTRQAAERHERAVQYFKHAGR